ncbi:hypothetical protein CJ030_MR1G018142 [Morella rubra]|uniref:Uncharacterized protein n=1 Tax=Morella rubra TaxID=262757 RepID=A0A6A1WMK5_9ROSI|nr:hypothetical protein CJ030_MR1G018142 [Morella rubra]
MELSYGLAEFMYLVVVRGLPVDMASYIYQSVHAEVLKTDAHISFAPTHSMVSDISGHLIALEQNVADMDAGWKKEVAALKEVLKGVATSAELFPLTQRVVLIEEHLRRVREVLKLTSDNDGDDF